MALVYIVACTVPQNLAGTTLATECAAANRRLLQVDDVELQAASLEIGIKPESIDPERVNDIYLLFIAFMVVLVAVWGIKRLLALFSSDIEK